MKRRHGPSIDDDFHVTPRPSDFVDALFVVELAFKPGDLIDLRTIERCKRDADVSATERANDKQLFH